MARHKTNSPVSIVRDIKRKNRRKFSSDEKIRIVLEGEARIAEYSKAESNTSLISLRAVQPERPKGAKRVHVVSGCKTANPT